MNERERILDLVKKGILSSEEGLVLLENLSAQNKQPELTPEDDKHEDEDQSADDQQADTDASNPEIDALSAKRDEVRAALDKVTEQIADQRKELAANDEQIIVYDTMDDLDTLTPEKAEARLNLKAKNKALTQDISTLEEKRADLKQQLSDAERDLRKAQMRGGFDKVFTDEWQNNVKSATADLGKAVTDAGSQIGSIVRKTARTVMDNVDWKDVTISVPGIATQKFAHTFTFPECKASIIDVTVANGTVKFRPWDSEDIEVAANIRFFGKVTGDLLDAFTQRSQIEADDEHFIFQVPNKRIAADLVISLPKREYDHIAVRNLNGDTHFDDISGKDVYAKTTNGDLIFDQLKAVMLEAENVNGDVKILKSDVNTAGLSTVNGDSRFVGTGRNLKLSTVNGDVKMTLKNAPKNVTGTSVNGDVKVAVPATAGVSGQAKTRFGRLRSRMTGIETPNKNRSHVMDLDRAGDELTVLTLSTAAGDVLLKDTDMEK